MGQMPKRSTELRRRNLDGRPEIVTIYGDPASVPPLREGLHPLAVSWYESLAESGQSQYYEPSDWMVAQIVAEAIDQFGRKPFAAALQSILTGSSLLLSTEGDRRRIRLELNRVAEAAKPADVIDWRGRATAGE